MKNTIQLKIPYTNNASLKLRYLAVQKFHNGHSRTAIAKTLNVSRRLVNEWITKYLSGGFDALALKLATGQPSRLNDKQKASIKEYVIEHAVNEQGGRLMGKDIQKYIDETYGVNYCLRNIYRLLKELELSWITSRSKHPKHDLAAQEGFKKIFVFESITTIPGHVALDKVDIWFQDEARFGQQNTTSRVWAEKGSRPRVVRQQQFISAHIYGAVCPSTGQTEALISPILSTEMMENHLRQISDATPVGRHALVIMDRASWHSIKLNSRFKNLSIIHLPPYAPELNPIEQVWASLRDNDLANFTYKNYEHIVEQVSRAWNNFRNQVEYVKSLCKREWANLIIN
ncbi:MAG: IS630 family transposase [Alteromonadales bacterium]|nr:IS630 family transposase [Alteromonadales bacterium]